MKKIILTMSVLALMAIAVPADQVNADNTQYYYLPTTYQPTTYQPTTVVTPATYGTPMTQAQLISYLQRLIAQLQAQLSSQNNYYGYNYNYGYEIGVPRSGSSNSSNFDDDEPEVETLSVRDIESTSAELRGEVDMNDFEDDIVFFVYGEDEDQVEDVEDDFDSYNDIDEDGDDLQKVKVDSSLGGDEEYERTITGLDSDTEYFFRICVEYEDEDDDETLVCGDVRDFETDN